jgi:subtilase family serine protease
MVLAVSAASAAAPHAVRVGPRPPVPAGSSVLGALTPTTPIDTTVVLKPRDPAALEAYATAVSTPGSALYHHYLSVSEFRQRFGPSDSQIAAVSASLRRHGLTAGGVTGNGLAIPVRANAGGLSRAFAVSLRRLKLRTGRTAFAPDQAPQVDASVAGLVQSVIGLDDVAVPHPLAVRTARPRARAAPHVVTGGPQPCGAASGSGVYTADELASAYRFSGLYGTGDQGAGQRVAIVELEPNNPSDIATYQACYGTGTSVSYFNVDGGAGAGAGSGEAAIDIEDVLGLAPQAAIDVYRAPNSLLHMYDDYNAIISGNAEKVISVSWGVCEAQEGPLAGAENALFQEAAAQGQSVFASAGDAGSSDCTDANGNPMPGAAVDDPASQPFVTGVGGTSLTSLGPPPGQSVWNGACSDGPCAGGGGVSSFWAMPSYQSGAPASLHVINPGSSGSRCGAPSGAFCREVPDVSGDADPSTGVAIFYSGNGLGWQGFGGTSIATPMFAALMALTNASSACGGVPVGFANPVLYGSAGHAYSFDFNDVTSGNNDISGLGAYGAGGGYDMASGLGSPQADQLAANICNPQVSVSNPGAQHSVVGVGVSMPVPGSDTAGYPLSYSSTGLPPGITISSAGTISGAPSAAGSYTATVRATDRRNRSGATTFTWTVDPVAVGVVNPGNRSGRVGRAFSLQMVAFDNNAGALSYSASSLPRGLAMKSNGMITGKPSSPGKFSVTVTARTGSTSGSTRFTLSIAGPTVSRASLSGVAKLHPKLAFTLSAGSGSPAVKKLQIGLPKGLGFSRSFRNGTTIRGANGKPIKGVKLKLSKGILVISLPKAVTRMRITIVRPAIGASRNLTSGVKHKKVHQVQLTLKPTDAHGFTSLVGVTLKPS